MFTASQFNIPIQVGAVYLQPGGQFCTEVQTDYTRSVHLDVAVVAADCLQASEVLCAAYRLCLAWQLYENLQRVFGPRVAPDIAHQGVG